MVLFGNCFVVYHIPGTCGYAIVLLCVCIIVYHVSYTPLFCIPGICTRKSYTWHKCQVACMQHHALCMMARGWGGGRASGRRPKYGDSDPRGEPRRMCSTRRDRRDRASRMHGEMDKLSGYSRCTSLCTAVYLHIKWPLAPWRRSHLSSGP